MSDYGKGYSVMPTVQKLNVLKVLEELEWAGADNNHCLMCGNTGKHMPECKIKLALSVLKAGISE